MKIEDQVCSLEQSKILKELGVVYEDAIYCFLQNSASKWNFGDVSMMFEEHIRDYEFSVHPEGFDESFKEQSCAAFTVAELGVMLPDGFTMSELTAHKESEKKWICGKVFGFGESGEIGDYDYNICKYGKTEAEARAELLIYLLETANTTQHEVNDKLNQPTQ